MARHVYFKRVIFGRLSIDAEFDPETPQPLVPPIGLSNKHRNTQFSGLAGRSEQAGRQRHRLLAGQAVVVGDGRSCSSGFDHALFSLPLIKLLLLRQLFLHSLIIRRPG